MHAIDRAYTRRARRRAAVAGLVAVVALAAGVPYGLRYLDSRGTPESTAVEYPDGVTEIPGVPTHVIDDATHPIELVDGWFVAGNQSVLNSTTGGYLDVGNVTEALLSPNGRWVAVHGSQSRVRSYDLRNDRSYLANVRSFFPSGMQWSPDGDTLLIAFPEFAGGETSVLFRLHAPTGGVAGTPLDATSFACAFDFCGTQWLPTGSEVAVIVGEAGLDGTGTVTGLQTFGLDGRPGRTLPISGYPAGLGAWSSDGRHVIVSGWSVLDTARILDVGTGEVVRSLAGLNLVQAQWIDDERFLAWEPIVTDGAVDARPAHRAIVSLDHRR